MCTKRTSKSARRVRRSREGRDQRRQETETSARPVRMSERAEYANLRGGRYLIRLDTMLQGDPPPIACRYCHILSYQIQSGASLVYRAARPSISRPLGDAGLDPRAPACTRPDCLRTCAVVSCARLTLSLRCGPLSLTAPMQVAGPLLQVSGPSPAHASPIHTYTDTKWLQ